MPKLTVDGNIYQVEEGTRLVLAIEGLGVRIGHRCGGNARCTTCRVEFISGEPQTMTQAEYERLQARGLYGQARLSCQIVCDHDMEVKTLVTAESNPEWNGDTGPAPETSVKPEARFVSIQDLTAGSN
jgi:ferredoxin